MEKSVNTTPKASAKANKDTSKKTTAKKTTAKKGSAKNAAAAARLPLIIVESPVKADKICKFLKNKYRVIASKGHVRDLPKSRIGVDVDNNFTPEYMNVRGKGDVLKLLKSEAKGTKNIYLATDPDREGEAISWHLAHLLGIDENNECRIVFNEITADAVRAALSSPRKIDINLVDAQQARRVLDRLIGYKLSPLLWAKVRSGLSAGRVQSVATRIICDREEEITDFVPEEYWTIEAHLLHLESEKTLIARFYGINGKKTELHNKEEADEIVSRARAGSFVVTDVKKLQKKRHAPAPFTTSTLQQDASRKLGFTAKSTMKTAQELYEGANFDSGLITYMRTDSVRVSPAAQHEALDIIRGRFGNSYAPASPNVYKGRKNAQDAHEAIRPTTLTLTPDMVKGRLTSSQYKLYKLIYNRFLASQMTEQLAETTTVSVDSNGCSFRITGTRILFDGFTVMYNESSEDEENVRLPEIAAGETMSLRDITGTQHFTAPPPRYTEATLVKALEELGIGRPSTYAPTLSTITERGYVKRDKKVLYPTELGTVINRIMKEQFSDIVNLRFTAEMEKKLDHIEEGDENWTHVIGEFYEPFRATVEKASEGLERVVLSDDISDMPCEKCGALMLYKRGRFGRFLACPNYPECKNTKPVVDKIDAPCPKCGASVIRRRAKASGNAFYGCERYPDCDFVSWDMPLKENCAVCGSHMVKKQYKNGSATVCSNMECKTNEKARARAAKKNAGEDRRA